MVETLQVRQVRVERLRNVCKVELRLAEGQNLIIGGNGQGKTTLLEALYLLGAIRSFRGARPAELIQHEAEEAVIRGSIGVREPFSEIVIILSRQGRQIRVDGKRAQLATHFHRFPIVAFHPGDLELVYGGPAIRRRFLDRMLFQAESSYAQWHKEYRRALSSRNELLKREASDRQIRAYDSQLCSAGARIGEARTRLTTQLAQVTGDILVRLGVKPFSVRLRANVEPNESALRSALERTTSLDRRRGRTSVGPHADDLELSRPTGIARVVASRGEARALTVALRLGERKVITRCSHATPLLLLDDVWAELDKEKAQRVLQMVATEPGQVVVTGTGGSEPASVALWRRFEVCEGQIVTPL